MFQKKKLIIFILILFSAGLGGYAYYHHKKYNHFAIHEEGMMYRSAWIEPETFSELIEKYQFRTIVNLCNPGEMGEERWVKERAAVKNAGARLIELPMPTTISPKDPRIAQHIEILNNPDNYPMLVHCQHGVTRTSKFLAIYDIIYRGETADESLDAQPLFGRKLQNVHVRAFAKQFEKEYKKLYPTASKKNLDVLKQ